MKIFDIDRRKLKKIIKYISRQWHKDYLKDSENLLKRNRIVFNYVPRRRAIRIDIRSTYFLYSVIAIRDFIRRKKNESIRLRQKKNKKNSQKRFDEKRKADIKKLPNYPKAWSEIRKEYWKDARIIEDKYAFGFYYDGDQLSVIFPRRYQEFRFAISGNMELKLDYEGDDRYQMSENYYSVSAYQLKVGDTLWTKDSSIGLPAKIDDDFDMQEFYSKHYHNKITKIEDVDGKNIKITLDCGVSHAFHLKESVIIKIENE